MLFGREPELSVIDGALARSRDGLGSLVLFTGEAGIGKSRLVREAAERAAAAGLRVAWGNCWEVGGAAPYWPWVQVFRSLERAPFDVPLPETHDFIQQRFKLFDSATRELAELARREPLVILLDDLHAADLPSLHFLSFVARQLAALPVALIGSARIPEFYAAPGVNDLLLGIMREGERVSLARLSREAVAKWVAGTADSEAVYAATEGNPLFVKEVLRLGAVARGPNDTIAKVLDAHLRLLPADAHGLLAMASVFGRQISVQELAALAGTSSDALREHLNTACSLGVLEPLDGSRLQFTHVLLRERLYEALRERSALEWKAGLLLETRGADPALVAHHLLAGVDAGDVARAGRAALRAIEHAQTTLAFEFAAAFAEEVLARLGTSLPAPLACELEVAFGEALMRAGSFSGGRAQCVRAAERARSLGHAEMQARAALAYGSEMLAASVDPVMVRLLEDAKSALGTGDSALGARVGARLAAALIPPATPEEAKRVQALSHAALATARRIGDRSALLWTLLFVRAALIALIHDDEVFALTEELVDLARSLEQRDVLMIVGPKHAVALLERGRRAEARAALAELVETAAEVRYPLLAWRVPMLRAAFAMFDGRLDEARELGEEALALAQKAGTQQANVVWAQQRIAIAIARREPASIAPDADRVLSMLRTNPLLSPIRAWVLAACGSPREALQELESLSERDQAFGLVFAAETCLLLESCPRDGEAMPDSLAALAARVRPLLSERWHGTRFFFGALAAGFVVGPVPRLLGELARLCGAADEARALFEESVALCRSLGSPAFLELSLGSLARLARDSAPALGVDVDTAAAEKRGSHREGPDPHVSIERTGDLWAVEGPSQRRFHLKHSKGLAYLSALVASPGHDIHVLALLGIEHRGGDGGPVLDAQARAEYRRRLSALDDEIDEAEKYGDVERARRARAQVESLGAELSRAVGLFGRERRTSSDVERARINVQRRIKDAIDAIERADPGLARYLRATIATGTFCSFTPV